MFCWKDLSRVRDVDQRRHSVAEPRHAADHRVRRAARATTRQRDHDREATPGLGAHQSQL